MRDNDTRIKINGNRICIIHKHSVERLNGDWHNCKGCARKWYENERDLKYWETMKWIQTRKGVENREEYPRTYKKYDEEKDFGYYEDFMEWLGETDGYFNARDYGMNKERADNEDYKVNIKKWCAECGRNSQKLYWVERKYLCWECRKIKWETCKVFMIRRVEKALEKYQDEYMEEIIEEKITKNIKDQQPKQEIQEIKNEIRQEKIQDIEIEDGEIQESQDQQVKEIKEEITKEINNNFIGDTKLMITENKKQQDTNKEIKKEILINEEMIKEAEEKLGEIKNRIKQDEKGVEDKYKNDGLIVGKIVINEKVNNIEGKRRDSF